MVGFGTSISAYNKSIGKKPKAKLLPSIYDPSNWQKYLPNDGKKYPSSLGRDNIGAPTGLSKTPIGSNNWNDSAVGRLKTAVSGGTSFSASGILGQQSSPVFQPQYSGLKQKPTHAYNRLNTIGQGNDILNEGINNDLEARNQMLLSRKRQREQSQPGIGDFSGYDGMGNSTGGGEFFGIGDGAGSGLDNEQLGNARHIANVGRQRGMDDQAIRIALMTALTESGLRNLNYGDRDSVGLFQQRTSQGWGTVQQIMDPTYSAGKFYDTLKGTNWRGLSPWAAAQAVQRSFDPTGNNYRVQWELANRGFNALSSRPGAVNYQGQKPNSAQGFIQQYNNRYVDYDGAYGAQCVDLYNVYTARFVGGQNIMVGWAPELYSKYDTRAYTRFDRSATPGRMGDVAVFNRGGSTPYGHVAIVVGDNGNGTLRVLHSNAGPQGSRGNSMISNISKSSLMGYLRPNKLMGR